MNTRAGGMASSASRRPHIFSLSCRAVSSGKSKLRSSTNADSSRDPAKAMATSGSTNFELDVADYIEEAFERCGLEARTGYDLKTARRSLNLVFANILSAASFGFKTS